MKSLVGKTLKMNRGSLVVGASTLRQSTASRQFTSSTALASTALKATSVVSAPMSPTTPLSFFGGSSSSSDQAKGAEISKDGVRALFNLWNDALATGDSRIVAKRYSSDPILLPTVSDTPRTDYDTIKDYFDNFLTMKPQGVILDGKIIMGPNWAQDAGVYEFTMGATGDKVKARYTFVYVHENGEWKISHHHSSTMPEQQATIGEDQAKNLFHLWNDALATCT